MKKRVYIGVVIGLCIPAVSFAQQVADKDTQLIFFEKQAWKDAKNEQALNVLRLEDELDFWNDQLHFEETLKQNNVAAYQMYIKGKSKAYTHHGQSCDAQCQHGTQYYLRASFYHGFAAQDGLRSHIPSSAPVTVHMPQK